MTIVVYKDGWLVADRAFSCGNLWAPPGKKIIKAGRYLVAFAGFAGVYHQVDGVSERMISDSIKHRKMLDIKNTSEWSLLIVDTRTGNSYRCDHHTPVVQCTNDFDNVMGSGAYFALAAIMAGASAFEAVTIANALDLNCGAGYHAFSVDGEEILHEDEELWSIRGPNALEKARERYGPPSVPGDSKRRSERNTRQRTRKHNAQNANARAVPKRKVRRTRNTGNAKKRSRSS